MTVNGKHYRTSWLNEHNPEVVSIIDQRHLPHKFVIEDIHSVKQMAVAIEDMHLRGAPALGAAAAYGMYLAALEARKEASFDMHINNAAAILKNTRPTAVNIAWGVEKQLKAMAAASSVDEKVRIAKETATQVADDEADDCKKIGLHGVSIIEQLSKQKKGNPVNILTHCNAGWLACVDYGSATAPIYEAFARGIPLHVWVDETRPRNQGASLTAWELLNAGIPHTVIADNTGGHLMQHGMVDVVITGADRVTRCGDAANKIGTYLKALAAHDNKVPFYIAIPSSTFDWNISDGVKEINIEERSPDEIKYVYGLHDNEIKKVLVTPHASPALNYGFDVTPSRLITGILTERGIMEATADGIGGHYPEKQMHERRNT
jgi:methylthioribose-1-phosphate isomerase